jgi:hypothetical protein
VLKWLQNYETLAAVALVGLLLLATVVFCPFFQSPESLKAQPGPCGPSCDCGADCACCPPCRTWEPTCPHAPDSACPCP